MKLYGGYLEFELAAGKEYHRDCLRLNSGRNALEFILRSNKYRKVYLPYYTCDVLLTPIMRTGVAYEHYSIGKDMCPLFDFASLQRDEAVVVTNFFGLLDHFIGTLSESRGNIIVDNAQAFFAKPVLGLDTFYSPRKFFGIPDGAYLAPQKKERAYLLYQGLAQDLSWDRCAHLLKRLDDQVEEGYTDFKQLGPVFQTMPVRTMSKLTYRMLDSIDYDGVSKKRRENFTRAQAALAKRNRLTLALDQDCVPLAYPFLPNAKGLRDTLIANGVFVPQYWANVSAWSAKDSLESDLAENLVAIPIDQRYDGCQLDYILDLVLELDNSQQSQL